MGKVYGVRRTSPPKDIKTEEGTFSDICLVINFRNPHGVSIMKCLTFLRSEMDVCRKAKLDGRIRNHALCHFCKNLVISDFLHDLKDKALLKDIDTI